MLVAWHNHKSYNLHMTEAPQIQDLVVAFVRAFGLHHPDQTPCGQPVSVSEAHVLMELGQAGPLRQKDLVTYLQLDKSTVSRLVGKLQRRGWLDRESDPRDGRAVSLFLTEAGRQTAKRLAVARSDKFSRLVSALGPEDHEAAVNGLAALVKSLNREKEGRSVADSNVE
jgi:DNA-binding MarR family transcriptional regulator